ncbi:MAG TPA: prepilin-type N-terminal cleavage/methylation domain-containing protein [Pyrinomonadaceae bacterium]|nr:prepilin-type N-terminal cleavage/methylation domain-containing protein [Pyrinomonadaceae bacterium]
MKNKTEFGFSLIELLIVVAIIGIIAAIAIPNLLASRRAANEGSAQSSLRTIYSCEMTYQASTGLGSFGTIAQLRGDFLTDEVLGSGTKSGYNFTVPEIIAPAPGVQAQFLSQADPEVDAGVSQTGTRQFCMAENGVLRGAIGVTPVPDRATCDGLIPLGN